MEFNRSNLTSQPQDVSKAGFYIQLARLSHEAFIDRRSYEWKINFALWISIGVFTYFAVTSSVWSSIRAIPWNWIIGTFYLIAFILYAFPFQIGLQTSNARDK